MHVVFYLLIYCIEDFGELEEPPHGNWRSVQILLRANQPLLGCHLEPPRLVGASSPRGRSAPFPGAPLRARRSP